MPPLAKNIFVFLTVPTNKKEASQWEFSLKWLFWRVFFLLLVNINLCFFFVCFGDGMTQNCVSFFLLWACWNKFQHGRRPLGWFFKHAIASLWRLGVAVKLAKLGTRTQKNRPKPARDYLFKHTFGVTLFNDCLLKQECMSIHVGIILKHAIVCLLFYTRMYNQAYEYPWLFEYCISLETRSCCLLTKLGTRTQKIGASKRLPF